MPQGPIVASPAKFVNFAGVNLRCLCKLVKERVLVLGGFEDRHKLLVGMMGLAFN